MRTLNLSVFGPVQVSLDDQPITQFRTTKSLALLIYLAVESATAHRRDALMTMLWPGMPERSARHNLRQILYFLRQTIPDVGTLQRAGNGSDGELTELLVTNRTTIQLNPAAAVEVDAVHYAALLNKTQGHDHADILACRICHQDLEQAVALYKDNFLSDYYLDDSSDFENWAESMRELYRRQVMDSLEILASISTRQKDYVRAREYVERQLAIDNLRESGYRQLMKICALAGRREEALVIYEQCRRLLADELGMAPATRTTRLYEQILAGDLSFDKPIAQGARGYELKDVIGEGSYGTIHRAVQPSIGREVAVKVIRQRYANDPEFIRRFEAEAQTVARLEHPYVVPLYDYWRDPEGAYLVMRYLRGGSLLSSLEGGPWKPERAAVMLDQIAGALSAAHQHGVVHRDIKPANILLDDAGNAYLSDFGIAKDLNVERQLTDDGALMGSLDYISPEQIKDEPVSSQSDLYSLGAVLYETLSGEKPFPDSSVANLLHSHLNEPFPLLTAARPDMPNALDDVLRKATAKEPADRFATALELSEAFRSAMRGQDVLHIESAPGAFPSITELYNPYKGLRAFQEADADDFFGRDLLVLQLLERMKGDRAGHDGAVPAGRFLAVVGPSGSGKSSVVKAGVIPALRNGAIDGSEKWFVAEMVPGSHPFEELEMALWSVAVDPPPNLIEPMQRDSRGIARTIRRILPDEPDAQLLLVIDQFEELFTLVPNVEHRDLFIDGLLMAMRAPRSPLRVVVTLRADFYDRPLAHQAFGKVLKENTEIVLPLALEELNWVVREPVRRMGIGLKEGLTEAIVADVADQPGALPLLQYALTEVFEHRQNGQMTLDAYRQIGGVLGALSSRAEQLYKALEPPSQEAVRQLFLRLVTLGEGVADTRRRVLRSELKALAVGENKPAVEEVIDCYGTARLLTFDHDPVSRGPTVEVAHEALLREWPRLRAWLERSRNDVRLQRRLAQMAADWVATGKDAGYLLRDARLDQFSGWAAECDLVLTSDEQEFLEASMSARNERLAAEETRRRQELETAQRLAETEKARAEEQAQAAGSLRKRAALLAGTLVIAGILAVAAVLLAIQFNLSAAESDRNAMIAQDNEALRATSEAAALTSANLAETREAEALAAGAAALAARQEAEIEADSRATAEAVAIDERLEAETQFQLARSRELAALGGEALEKDPQLAILLALEALSSTYTAAGENLLHQAVLTSRIRQRFNSGSPLDWFFKTAVTPDGEYVVACCDTRDGSDTVIVWSTETGELLYRIPQKIVDLEGNYKEEFYISADGSRLATLEEEESFIISFADLSTGDELATHGLPLSTKNVSHFALNPSWDRVAIGFDDGTASVWDLASGEQLFTLDGHVEGRVDVGYSPDNRYLISKGPELVNVWEPSNGQELASFSHGAVNGIFHYFDISQDGRLLALPTFNGNGVNIWDLDEAIKNPVSPVPWQTLRLEGHNIFGLGFSADGTKIATGGRDQTARVWDTFTGEQLLVLPHGASNAITASLNPEGTLLVSGGTDGTAKLWDISPEGAEELYTMTIPPNGFSMDLSPDEKQLAITGRDDGTVTIWDVDSRQILQSLTGHTGRVATVSFNPNGQQIASAGDDGTAIIWDLATGESLFTLDTHGPGNVGGSHPGVLDLDYRYDGRRLVTAGADGTARIWDTETGEELLVIDHPTGLTQAKFSPDGALLATASEVPEANWYIRDAMTGELLITVAKSHSDRIWALAFSPDGTMLATAGTDSTAKLWRLDPASGSATLVATLLGHRGPTVIRLSFSADGRSLATLAFDEVKLWDLSGLASAGQDGQEAASLTAPRFTLPIVPAVIPGNTIIAGDGSQLLYVDWAGDQQAVRFITLDLDELKEIAAERLTRTLTEEECLQYQIKRCS